MEAKEINGHQHLRYQSLNFTEKEVARRSQAFLDLMNKHRSVRNFSNRQVPKSVINNLLKTAGTAPSGAHQQPCTFCAISNAEITSEIKQAAEKEEYESYHGRMSDRWLKDLDPVGTGWQRTSLETAPCLIVIFKKVHEWNDGEKANNYYVNESVGIAAGILMTAIHHAGLVTLTLSPMSLLASILKRPSNKRPFLLLPVGYPADEAFMPDLKRNPPERISVHYR